MGDLIILDDPYVERTPEEHEERRRKLMYWWESEEVHQLFDMKPEWVRCERCGRPLRTEKSMSRGIGPTCLKRQELQKLQHERALVYMDEVRAQRKESKLL